MAFSPTTNTEIVCVVTETVCTTPAACLDVEALNSPPLNDHHIHKGGKEVVEIMFHTGCFTPLIGLIGRRHCTQNIS